MSFKDPMKKLPNNKAKINSKRTFKQQRIIKYNIATHSPLTTKEYRRVFFRSTLFLSLLTFNWSFKNFENKRVLTATPSQINWI